jgi:hypothetical protein
MPMLHRSGNNRLQQKVIAKSKSRAQLEGVG